MFPTGILVKTRLDDLVSSLPDRIVYCGPQGIEAAVLETDTDAAVMETLELQQWSEDWCLINVDGTEALSALAVESLVRYRPVSELISCRFIPEAGEYSYSYFRDGELLENFECSGPSMETINFTSEIRKVPLQNILRASEFMTASMNELGIDQRSRQDMESKRVVVKVDFPGKRTFWQILLGAVSKK